MDNKKWYKRISTCFWFMLATAPVWLTFIGSLFSFFAHTDSLTGLNDLINYYKQYYLLNYFNSNISQFFQNLIPTFIKEPFTDLFTTLGISSGSSTILTIMFSWFIWTYFIELIVDFVAFFPRLIHSFMERWCTD